MANTKPHIVSESGEPDQPDSVEAVEVRTSDVSQEDLAVC
jgi:hypothetical protein